MILNLKRRSYYILIFLLKSLFNLKEFKKKVMQILKLRMYQKIL